VQKAMETGIFHPPTGHLPTNVGGLEHVRTAGKVSGETHMANCRCNRNCKTRHADLEESRVAFAAE